MFFFPLNRFKKIARRSGRAGARLVGERVGNAETWRRVGVESARTMRVGLPVVLAQLLQMSMGFVDTIMAGNLSARDLAAVAVGYSLVAPIWVSVIGVLMAINAVVAQLYGAEEHREVGRNFWQGLWLSQFLAVAGFIAMRNLAPVMTWLDIRPEIQPIARGYLHAFSWGVPASFAYFALRFFWEGLSITRPSMYFAMVGVVVNILGNYVFMYGHLGFPAMGAVGTGWATTLVWWVMLAGLAGYTLRSRVRWSHLFDRFVGPGWFYLKEMLRVGVPNGVSLCVEVTMFATVSLIIGSLGVNTVAGHQIAINFAAITFMVPLGLSIATTARVGFAVGRGSLEEARFVGYIGIGLSFLVMTLTAVLMLTFPETIAGIYTDDPEVKTVAVGLLFFAAVFQISDGLQVSSLGALRGLKDTRIPMLVNVFAYWLVGLPSGYVLGLYVGLGARGLWMGLIAGLTAAAVLHNLRFHRLTAKSVKVLEC